MFGPPPTIVLVGGWSWHRHVGDDAILRAHLTELRRALPRHETVVVCGEPERLARRLPLRTVWSAAAAIGDLRDPRIAHADLTSDQLVPVVARLVEGALDGRAGEFTELVDLVEAIERADAVVAASAGSLAAAYRVTIAEQVVVLAIAQALGKPTVLSGASLGPFDDADCELLGPALAAADLVAVRDGTISLGRAARLGIEAERLEVQPDPACWMEAGPGPAVDAALARVGIESGRPFGLLTAAPWPGGLDQSGPLAAAVDAVAEATGLPFAGLPMYVPPGPNDTDALDAIRDQLADPDRLVRVDPLPDDPDLATLSARASVVVGSRFHGAVFAAMGGTPAVLVYDGAYQRDKAESLAASTAAVRAVSLAAGADAIAAAVLEQLASDPAPLRPSGPLPAVAWLERKLSRRWGRLRALSRLLRPGTRVR